jgi:hypothetical protein
MCHCSFADSKPNPGKLSGKGKNMTIDICFNQYSSKRFEQLFSDALTTASEVTMVSFQICRIGDVSSFL